MDDIDVHQLNLRELKILDFLVENPCKKIIFSTCLAINE
jgi:hypothetical protein